VRERPRVLLAGWLNAPHVCALVELVGKAGHDVHVVGYVAPGWPELDEVAFAARVDALYKCVLRTAV
jgi:hypothetical protein